MTQEQLLIGKRISEKLAEFDRCIEALERSRDRNDDMKTTVVNFLTSWNLIGSSATKNQCAEIAFNAILEHLRESETVLQSEFDSL